MGAPVDVADQVRQLGSVKLLKRTYRAQRKTAARSRRRERHRQIRCWWTWPLGHEYAAHIDEDGHITAAFCVGCQKRR